MLTVSHRSSGLFLAEQAAAPEAIRHALKRLDDQLVLAMDVDAMWDMPVWKVMLRRGDRPAVWLFDWRENIGDPVSRPRPLSHGIVDEASAARLDSRRDRIDPLKANDELLSRLDRDEDSLIVDTARDVERRAKVLYRSHGLRGCR